MSFRANVLQRMLQTQNLRFSVFFKKEALVLGKDEKGLCWVGWRIKLNLTRMELSAHGSDNEQYMVSLSRNN